MSCMSIDEALERFDGDTALWSEFAETWLETVQADHDGLLNALAENDAPGALYHVHKMKGSSATIGASALSAIGQSIEIEVRELKLDLARSLMGAFEQTYNASLRETKGFIAGFRGLS